MSNTMQPRLVRIPSAPVVVGGVYAVCVVGLVAAFGLQVLVTDIDPYASEGPYESMASVGLVGTLALILAAGVATFLSHRPERARVGALVFAALAVITAPIFWSGTPGIFGACAAWLGGLTRGASPQTGAARVAAIVGIAVALMNIVVTVVSTTLSMVTGS